MDDGELNISDVARKFHLSKGL